ncbi:zinc-binding dehydrogenase [Thalassotalea aquiviva]|uniref:zinc-binding dehydrogenase n=1 Tax=Thalassotalea aquiviva TaxID=3242415 RepID=UPI00352B73E0
MKALSFDPSTDTFDLIDKPIPEPSDYDVLLQVNACGLNPVDVKITQWKSLVPNMHAQWVPGLDVSGTVIAKGRYVTQWQIGDNVLTHGDMLKEHGGFAQYSVQDARSCIVHPNVDSAVAAATPCAGWTAWRALVDKLRCRKGQSVFIAGGSGGVGSFAVQIAAYFQLKPIIASCSKGNFDFVKSLGADHIIDYQQQDELDQIRDLTNGQGVNLGVDTVGIPTDQMVANALGYEGKMVELVDVVRPDKYQDVFLKGLSFHQLSLGSGHRNGEDALADLVLAGEEFSALLEQGKLRVPKLAKVGFTDLKEALLSIAKQRTVGKVVLSINE